MSTFHIGQRVRIKQNTHADPRCRQYLGVETRIHGKYAWDGYWELAIVDEYGRVCAADDALEPLTDPKADEFIEGLKKLGREPAPREEEAFAKVRKLLEQSE